MTPTPYLLTYAITLTDAAGNPAAIRKVPVTPHLGPPVVKNLVVDPVNIVFDPEFADGQALRWGPKCMPLVRMPPLHALTRGRMPKGARLVLWNASVARNPKTDLFPRRAYAGSVPAAPLVAEMARLEKTKFRSWQNHHCKETYDALCGDLTTLSSIAGAAVDPEVVRDAAERLLRTFNMFSVYSVLVAGVFDAKIRAYEGSGPAPDWSADFVAPSKSGSLAGAIRNLLGG